MRDGRMRCAMLCAMVGCDARGNFHRILPSRLASRDAIFSDFHRASHRAMRGARKKTSRLASRDARREGKTSRLASRDARRDVFS